ncbi:hypothetical protein [Pseudomonas sp. Pseu.R1]|uniref:hypothetical protein n=1 Tax=Pseudomonas sp. Pseu.R1 TaxID=3379818 RepID=UPI003B95E4D3
MNSRDNILQLALTNNALEKFIVGEPPYFQKGKTDNEEPQNVMGAFDQLVVRHWRETHDARFASQFVAAQLSALATCPDANRAMYMVSDWLWYYRFCLTKTSVTSWEARILCRPTPRFRQAQS